MDIRERLKALAAQPREWRITTIYADGATRTHDAHSEAAANTHATGERRKIGRNLINRETGNTVRVVGVTIAKIGG